MQSIDWMVALFVAATSFGVAIAALWVTAHLSGRSRVMDTLWHDEMVFLFQNEALVDATERATQLVGSSRGRGSDLDRLIAALKQSFPNLRAQISQMDADDRVTLRSQVPGSDSALCLQLRNEQLRIELFPDRAEPSAQIDKFSLSAMEDELRTLRASADYAPFLIWQQTPEGTITWANKTYLAILKSGEAEDTVATWPPKPLFEDSQTIQNIVHSGPKRLSTPARNGRSVLWFDVHSARVGEDILFFAVEADALVAAETALRDFVQTLTKTFAHLPTGLAIFDKRRQLVLFNPALTDLTTLPVDFLSSRPTLVAFLDRLREKQMMPEPKDYKTWRQQLSELEAAASDGTYEENWTLPTGQTYSVAGRPHPDGAVAFLFSDITSEISLTRRFRSELEVGQAVVDALDEAIAVFSSAGVLTLSNRSFEQIWGVDPTSTLGEFGIIDASRVWQKNCEPNPIWGDIRDFIDTYEERAEWFGEAILKDGRQLLCRITPLAGGATLVGFSIDRSQRAANSPEAVALPA